MTVEVEFEEGRGVQRNELGGVRKAPEVGKNGGKERKKDGDSSGLN